MKIVVKVGEVTLESDTALDSGFAPLERLRDMAVALHATYLGQLAVARQQDADAKALRVPGRVNG